MRFPSASAFRALGLYPFPLEDPIAGTANSGKKPRFDHWQMLAVEATDAQRGVWEASHWNLGLFLGPSRLVVLDSDTAAAEAWVARLPATPWITRTAQGRHRFYRLADGTDAPSNRVRLLACGLDRKCGGGYVVAPGSIHWSGVLYEAEGDWTVPLAELPCYDPAWFPQKEILRAAPLAAPLDGATDVVKRARAYVARVPPAIEKQGGNAHTYRLCCVLLRDFALSKGEAMACLLDWNLTCSPPWSAVELEELLDHAEVYARGSHGSKLQAQAPRSTGRLLWRGA